MENLSVISLICGIPGSGKTCLINTIRQLCLGHAVVNKSEFKNIDMPLTEVNLYVISYDELIPVIGHKEMKSISGIWKETRRDVICAADAFICHIIGLPFSSQLSYTANTFLEKLVQSNKQNVNHPKKAFLVDDNFYYKSMRYEWYLLAKKLNMGFCQIYLECPLEIASSRNRARKTAIPDDVIYLMAKRIEAPNQNKNPWEKNSICINTGYPEESLLNRVLIIIEASLKKPLKAKTIDIDKEKDKRICSTNVIHQIDIILRHLTGEKIKEKQASCHEKITKKYSKILNDARREVLKALKQEELILSTNLLDAIESGDSDDSELQRTIAAIFESSIHSKIVMN